MLLAGGTAGFLSGSACRSRPILTDPTTRLSAGDLVSLIVLGLSWVCSAASWRPLRRDAARPAEGTPAEETA